MHDIDLMMNTHYSGLDFKYKACFNRPYLHTCANFLNGSWSSNLKTSVVAMVLLLPVHLRVKVNQLAVQQKARRCYESQSTQLKMKVKNFFCTLRRLIHAMHLYALHLAVHIPLINQFRPPCALCAPSLQYSWIRPWYKQPELNCLQRITLTHGTRVISVTASVPNM